MFSSSLPLTGSESFSNDLIAPRCSLPHRIVSVRRVGLGAQDKTDQIYYPESRGCRDKLPLACCDAFYYDHAGLESKMESIGLDFLE